MKENKFIQKEFSWNVHYELATTYYNKNGNLIFPITTEIDNTKLSNWLFIQKQSYVKDILSEIKITKLEALNIVWDAPSIPWVYNCALAKRYYELNGD